MARKRYSLEQIVAAVKRQAFGTPIVEICRKLGIAETPLPALWNLSGTGAENRSTVSRDLPKPSNSARIASSTLPCV